MENDFINRQVAIDAFRDTVDLMPECYARDIIADLPSAQPDLQPVCNQLATDTISRQAAIDAMAELQGRASTKAELKGIHKAWKRIKQLPSAQPESTRTFVELVVRYPDPELCTYKEYKGKPYYSIKYIENGETYVGYGTYNPEVLSQYLKEYFISVYKM